MLTRRNLLCLLALTPIAAPVVRPASTRVASLRRLRLERSIIGCMVMAPLLRSCRCLDPSHFGTEKYRRAYVLLTSDERPTPDALKLWADCVDDLPNPGSFHDYVDALKALA